MSIKKIFDKIDLSKKLPKGYLNKAFLNTFWFLILVLFVAAFASNDLKFVSYYAKCPDYKESCINPFIDNHEICETAPYACEKTVLQGGEEIGKNPSFLFKYFNLITISLILSAYGLNHLIWRRKNAN